MLSPLPPWTCGFRGQSPGRQHDHRRGYPVTYHRVPAKFLDEHRESINSLGIPMFFFSGSTAVFHVSHWDLSYDTFPWFKTMGSMHLREPFARGPALAAIVLFMAEIGLLD